MLDELYDFLRGAAGFSLVLAGCGFLVAPRPDRIHRAFGSLFIAVGSLFCLSALDPVLPLGVDLGNLLIASLIWLLSDSLLAIAFYLFGNERRAGSARWLGGLGALISAGLVLLPLLDYLFGWGPVVRSVEDGRALGPLHSIAAVAIYAWPIISAFIAFSLTRWQAGDIPTGDPSVRRLLLGLGLLALILLGILLASAFSLRAAYRLLHVLLELLLIAGYLYVVRKPEFFLRVRDQIGKEHARKLHLGEDEAELIARRLEILAADPGFLRDEDLDIAMLARRLGIPPYRLSHWFSSRLGTTFPAWRNERRIRLVLRLMAERPGLSILELALEAGYSSKTTFNKQFARIAGMSPSDYRRGLGAGK
jgi:AraC-like DNA-binding protein